MQTETVVADTKGAGLHALPPKQTRTGRKPAGESPGPAVTKAKRQDT